MATLAALTRGREARMPLPDSMAFFTLLQQKLAERRARSRQLNEPWQQDFAFAVVTGSMTAQRRVPLQQITMFTHSIRNYILIGAGADPGKHISSCKRVLFTCRPPWWRDAGAKPQSTDPSVLVTCGHLPSRLQVTLAISRSSMLQRQPWRTWTLSMPGSRHSGSRTAAASRSAVTVPQTASQKLQSLTELQWPSSQRRRSQRPQQATQRRLPPHLCLTPRHRLSQISPRVVG